MGIPVTIEFSGGAELLFDNKRKMDIELPVDDTKNESDTKNDSNNESWTIEKLIQHLKEKYLKERPEFFVQGNSVRPGILVLVNETDWELVGELNYEIQPNDCILFISTLHGG